MIKITNKIKNDLSNNLYKASTGEKSDEEILREIIVNFPKEPVIVAHPTQDFIEKIRGYDLPPKIDSNIEDYIRNLKRYDCLISARHRNGTGYQVILQVDYRNNGESDYLLFKIEKYGLKLKQHSTGENAEIVVDIINNGWNMCPSINEDQTINLIEIFEILSREQN